MKLKVTYVQTRCVLPNEYVEDFTIRIRIMIKLYFTLVLKTINISFKFRVTNGNKKTYSNKIHKVR